MSDLTKMVNPLKGTFTWGTLIKIHHVANFEIVEYETEEGETMFQPFVDENDTRQAYSSLKEAIVGAIVFEENVPASEILRGSQEVHLITTLIFKMIRK